MTQTKHTPGPWLIAEPNFPCRIYTPQTNRIIATACEQIFEDEHRETPTMKANARLIASAPELLEACKEGKLLLSQLQATLEDDRMKEVLSQFAKSIAKAEGSI